MTNLGCGRMDLHPRHVWEGTKKIEVEGWERIIPAYYTCTPPVSEGAQPCETCGSATENGGPLCLTCLALLDDVARERYLDWYS